MEWRQKGQEHQGRKRGILWDEEEVGSLRGEERERGMRTQGHSLYGAI